MPFAMAASATDVRMRVPTIAACGAPPHSRMKSRRIWLDGKRAPARATPTQSSKASLVRRRTSSGIAMPAASATNCATDSVAPIHFSAAPRCEDVCFNLIDTRARILDNFLPLADFGFLERCKLIRRAGERFARKLRKTFLEFGSPQDLCRFAVTPRDDSPGLSSRRKQAVPL